MVHTSVGSLRAPTVLVVKGPRVQRREYVMQKKRQWETPVVRTYGDMNSLTQQVKLKKLGLSDDFGITGISNP